MEEQTNQIYENSAYTNKKNDVQQNNVPPKNYMTLAVITTILSSVCCNPLGLILGGFAIYFANEVSREYVQGNYSSALSKSNTVKIMIYVNIALLAFYVIIYALYIFFSIISRL